MGLQLCYSHIRVDIRFIPYDLIFFKNLFIFKEMTLFVTNSFVYWDLYALHVRRVSQLCYYGVDKFEQPIKMALQLELYTRTCTG